MHLYGEAAQLWGSSGFESLIELKTGRTHQASGCQGLDPLHSLSMQLIFLICCRSELNLQPSAAPCWETHFTQHPHSQQVTLPRNWSQGMSQSCGHPKVPLVCRPADFVYVTPPVSGTLNRPLQLKLTSCPGGAALRLSVNQLCH